MSSYQFSNVSVGTAPSTFTCGKCGFPEGEGDRGQRQNPVELVSHEKHEDEERPPMMTAETAQADVFREVAYAKFKKTMEGTPEHDQALEGFILLLFPDCTSTTDVLPEAQELDVPPRHAA